MVVSVTPLTEPLGVRLVTTSVEPLSARSTLSTSDCAVQPPPVRSRRMLVTVWVAVVVTVVWIDPVFSAEAKETEGPISPDLLVLEMAP